MVKIKMTESKLYKRPILQEIELLRKQIEDLRKQLDRLQEYVFWGSSYIEELLKVVGIQ